MKKHIQNIFAATPVFLFLLFGFAEPLSSESPAQELSKSVDPIWIIVCAALVFFMQAGFLMLETGLSRLKNTINVAVKNLMDYIVGTIAFFFVGFGLMFGLSNEGWIGTDLFFLEGLKDGKEFAFFLFKWRLWERRPPSCPEPSLNALSFLHI